MTTRRPLERLSRRLSRRLIRRRRAADLAALLASETAVGTDVVVLTDDSPADIVETLRRRGRPALIIDATGAAAGTSLFRETFWALRDGGRFVTLRPGRRWRREIRSLAVPDAAGPVAAQRRRQELARSILTISDDPSRHVVQKRGDHYAIVGHADVEDVLSDRYGDAWGRVLTRRPSYEFASRAQVVMHGEASARDKPAVVQVPELAVREYHDVTCHLREIVTKDDLILPDTFRHWQSRQPFHKRIHPASVSFGRPVDLVADATVTRVGGAFFGLDSAFPAHFGHLMTETISRLWGWPIALAEHPGLRPVMTHQSGKAALPDWKRDVLRSLGIPVDDILWIREGEAARVETLVAAMPQLENPHYVDLGICETWERMGALRPPASLAGRAAEKIFLSRRGRSQRACVNAAEVEAFFEANGFTVLLPEDLPFAEQVRAFAGARIIAGFGGSAFFTAAVNPAARLLVLTSRSYVAANEYLIAAANGNELHYFWSPPLIDQPAKGFSAEAYRSGFTFPLDEHRSALLAAMS